MDSVLTDPFIHSEECKNDFPCGCFRWEEGRKRTGRSCFIYKIGNIGYVKWNQDSYKSFFVEASNVKILPCGICESGTG